MKKINKIESVSSNISLPLVEELIADFSLATDILSLEKAFV